MTLRAVLAMSVAAAVTAAPSGAARTAPTLRLLDRDPVVVRGSGFRPLERLTVAASTRTLRVERHVRAGRTGGFKLRFSGLVGSICSGLGIRALRPSGTAIWLKLPLPACMPDRLP